MKAARAMHRGYVKGGHRSALVRRLHVIRDTPVRSQSVDGRDGAAGSRTWCGQGTGPHQNSEPVVVSPMPDQPPGDLAWCPACIGHLAEYYGLLGEIAASLAAYDPELTDLAGDRWRYVEDQRDVRRSALLRQEGAG